MSLHRSVVAATVLVVLLSGPARAEDQLKRIKARGELRWTADASGGVPFVFEDPRQTGHIIGFEAELAEAIAGKLGVKAKFIQCDYKSLLELVNRGDDADVAINGIEQTSDKRGYVEMSRPYYVASMRLAQRDGTPDVKALDQLKGKRVGVLPDTSADRLATAAGAVAARYDSGFDNVYKELAQGRTDAVLTDEPTAHYYAPLEPGIHVLPAAFGELRYVIACRNGEARLTEALNEALEELRTEGKLRAIYEKWQLWNAATAILLDDHDRRTPAHPDGYDYWIRSVSHRSFSDRLKTYPEKLPTLLKGAAVTLGISLVSFVGAVLLGITLALTRRYGPKPLQLLAVGYIELFRGTPLLVQLYFIYFGLPDFGINLSPISAGILGLALNYAAAEAENYRAGLESVPSGQVEAAWSLGLSTWQAVRFVIAPQAVRIAIPPATNDFIALLKDSSLVSAITINELLKEAQTAATATRDSRGFYALCALIYLLLGLPFSRFARYVEQRMGQHLRRGS